MDFRKLKVGQTVWYVNTSPPDYDSLHPSDCLELWKGKVISINPDAEYPVKCTWDRVGGYANWVAPEYGWNRYRERGESKVKTNYNNRHIFPTPKAAITNYLLNHIKSRRDKLMAQAKQLMEKPTKC